MAMELRKQKDSMVEDAKTIETRLIERRRQLWQEIREDIEKKGMEDHRRLMQDLRDQGDTAIAELQESINYRFVQKKAEEIEHINASLEKLKNGEYGICEDCGEPIAPERLRVLPYATRCRECQEKWDRIHGI
jgi:DnaK suppressor protein